MGVLLGHLAGRDGAAVVDGRGPTSWGTLVERVDALARYLRADGLAEGESVALIAGNRSEMVEVYLACLEGGWQCVPVNWHYEPHQMAYVLADSGASCVVVGSNQLRKVVAAIDHAGESAPRRRIVTDGAAPPGGFVGYESALAAAPSGGGEHADASAHERLGGVTFYTSGTTGRPKGVRQLRPRFEPPAAIAAAASLLGALGVPEHGSTLLSGPHYHAAQWTTAILPLLTGSTLHLHPRFVPELVLAAIDEHAITNVNLVPTQFVRLLRVRRSVRETFDGGSLRVVLHGAAPSAPDTKRAMIDGLGPIVTEFYGSTELGIVTCISSDEWLARPVSVGRPLPGVEVRVLDDDGEPVPVGIEGTIYVRRARGDGFEFLNAPELTAAAHKVPGFVTVGDVGSVDDEGYVYLADRGADTISSIAGKIEPFEVERVLLGHPSIVDAGVFGVPNADGGDDVKAAVQLADGVEWSAALERELIARCHEHLPSDEVPVGFDVVETMPRNALGKLLKRELRAPYLTNRYRGV